jgi:hypothetical protein
MKTWPSFDERWDLPVGIHQSPLSDVVQHFGRSTFQRSVLARRLERIYELANSTGHLARFVIFGSFITAKLEPNDVDIFLLMDDSFDVQQVAPDRRVVFDHQAAQNQLGASIFWIRRAAALGGETATITHWQIKRGGTRRGIVEVITHD